MEYLGASTYKLICHVCVCVCVCARVPAKSIQSCSTLCDTMDCSPPGPLCQRDSPGKNPGVGCHALLQGIYLTQGLNPCLMSPALAGGFFTTSATWEVSLSLYIYIYTLDF